VFSNGFGTFEISMKWDGSVTLWIYEPAGPLTQCRWVKASFELADPEYQRIAATPGARIGDVESVRSHTFAFHGLAKKLGLSTEASAGSFLSGGA
jgi:hypothetical protein